MADPPWQGDACSLVEAFRSGERSPSEELTATYVAIEASDLNAFSNLHREQAEAAAQAADVNMPFGGVPIGVKELDRVEGWPDTHACVVYRDQVATDTSTNVARARDPRWGGTGRPDHGVRVRRGQRHPYRAERHHPQSLAARAHSGWIVWWHRRRGGRRPRHARHRRRRRWFDPHPGRLRRSRRSEGDLRPHPAHSQGRTGGDDGHPRMSLALGSCTARWFDVCNGHDPREPLSLPRVEGWEADLGTHLDELRGKRVAIVPDWGAAVVSPVMWELLEEAAIQLISDCGLTRVEGVDTELPRMGAAWSVANSVGLINQLQDYWPECADDLTPEIRMSMEAGPGRYGADARIKLEQRRTELNEKMAQIFDVAAGGVDFVITASNPDVAFDADGPLPNTFGGIKAGAKINGRLTFPANMYGNPAVSIPAGFLDGLPIGLQVVGPHFSEPLLLDVALTAERNRPWPLTINALV